jgi:hypothetical protein
MREDIWLKKGTCTTGKMTTYQPLNLLKWCTLAAQQFFDYTLILIAQPPREEIAPILTMVARIDTMETSFSSSCFTLPLLMDSSCLQSTQADKLAANASNQLKLYPMKYGQLEAVTCAHCWIPGSTQKLHANTRKANQSPILEYEQDMKM